MPTSPKIVARLRDVVGGRDLALVDVWGVLHNGLAAHQAASEALARFRAGGGYVVLISNAPRPSEIVVGMLDRLGVARQAYDALVTSGDVTRAFLAASPEAAFFHLGPARDRPIFEGLRLHESSLEEAERVVCTGLLDDETETAEDYRPFLTAMLERRQLFVCANPDLVVERGHRLVPCAGALAECYERLGGTVHWAGKPHPAIYDAALALAETSLARRLAKDKVLAIGDALRTDVAGASNQGYDCLFVADGIHAKAILVDGGIDAAALERESAQAGFTPYAAIPRLVW